MPTRQPIRQKPLCVSSALGMKKSLHILVIQLSVKTNQSDHLSPITADADVDQNVNPCLDSTTVVTTTAIVSNVREQISTDKGYCTGELTSDQKRVIINNKPSRPLGPYLCYLFISIPVSIASAERSFSKLK